MTAKLLDRLETPVLAVAYISGDTSIEVDACPQEVIDKGPEFAILIDGILFRVTDTGGGSTTWNVTRDVRTADHNIVLGSPVYIWFTAWQIEELLANLVPDTFRLPSDAALSVDGDATLNTTSDHVQVRAAGVTKTVAFTDDVPTLPDIEDLTTAETDTTLVYAPDGAGGVVARAETAVANGHWEVIMFGSAPPEPVTNGAEDDWLYMWVPD